MSSPHWEPIVTIVGALASSGFLVKLLLSLENRKAREVDTRAAADKAILALVEKGYDFGRQGVKELQDQVVDLRKRVGDLERSLHEIKKERDEALHRVQYLQQRLAEAGI